MPVETDNRFKAVLLTDLSRLQEIFELRVIAWSDKEGSKINSHSHPKGWSDSLDQSSLHWIIENENKDIIAAARLTELQSLNDLPYPGIFKRYFTDKTLSSPFCFYSKQVIHPGYRGKRFSNVFDEVRIAYQKSKKIKDGLVLCNGFRVQQHLKNGFEIVGLAVKEDDLAYDYTSMNEDLLIYRM
ncbi:MAG: hypothetical protein IAF38_04520 [Bacteroidia bacterium]|nr:hypothetical protein [Bacteroidia bacterium]